MLVLSPPLTVACFTAGDLLLAWEANRPGTILPGASGVLLVLVAAGSVLRSSGSMLALVPLVCAVVFFALDARRPQASFTVLTGASMLALLVLSALPAHSVALTGASVLAGLLLAVVHGWMARIAWRARRNKGLD